MKKVFKKLISDYRNITIVALLILVIIFAIPKGMSVFNAHYPNEISNTFNKVTCTFPQMVNSYYENYKIEHTIPKPEVNPLTFTYVDLGQERAILSYIDATKTISTVEIYRLVDKADRYIYLEGGFDNYFTTHTIFKDTGVAIYTKSVINPFGTPVGSMAMGSCVGI